MPPKIEYRRCLGGNDGSICTIESAAGRGAKGVRSVVCRYVVPSGEAEILYESKERLQDGLWLSPGDALYTVDSKGHVHTNRGGSWKKTRVSKLGLSAIWGLDDDLVLTGGDGGAAGLFRFDGTRWATLQNTVGLQDLEPSARILHLGGTSPVDWYVAAHNVFDQPQKCSLLHFNGSAFAPMEMRRKSRSSFRQVAKKGIPGRVNSVYCRNRDEVFVCGAEALLMVGNPRAGWKSIGELRRDQKAYCFGAIGKDVYFAWSDDRHRSGVMRWNGKTTKVVRDDIRPWHLSARNDRLYVTWRSGFGCFDGRRWEVCGTPDFP